MQIENESQWNSEDLVALTKKVAERQNIDLTNGLLIFKTARRSVGRRRRRSYGQPPAEKGSVVIEQAASTGWYRGIGGGAKVVEIYSKEKLIEKNVLERLGAVTYSDVRQDIHPRWIRDIAIAIGDALTGTYRPEDATTDAKWAWAEKMQLRAASKITRSALLTRKKIETLQGEKERVKRSFERELENYDRQIEKLRAEIEG
jgi:hypothetical protein